ncbi:MAG: anthranilate phosphoribosyltransferase [Candidatus Omnitrophota bacterium]|nr:anthranilate phosphoribosyltransferase [Candidatus Omnitrophota bacterium]
MIKEAIVSLFQHKDLSRACAQEAFEEILSQKATNAQIAAFLVALAAKQEKEIEITAAALTLRKKAIRVIARESFVGIENTDEPIFDTCGTGGSGVNKFNISTATAFVVSAAGIRVAKHGNRAMTSSCGSADVLEALGVTVTAEPRIMGDAIRAVGVGFLFAPLYHPALAGIAQIRREIGIRTIFNILGPLCNPAGATHQLLGVYRKELLGTMARVLRALGTRRAFVVHSSDLKDEISLSSTTAVAHLHKNKIEKISIRPSDFGLKKIKIKDIEVGNAKESARVITGVLGGKRSAAREIVLANAGASLYILGCVANLKEGARIAATLIDTGAAQKKLFDLKEFIRSHA